jgi:hypothetical protein
MNALFLLIRGSMTSQPSRQTPSTPSEEPMSPIRPGAFARWIAEMEGHADRDEFAANEGIAAARPGAVPEPGWARTAGLGEATG